MKEFRRSKILFLWVVYLLAVLLFFAACDGGMPRTNAKSGECRVVLSESGFYTCEEYIKTVSRGENVEYTLKMENGYKFAGASYGDYEADVLPPDADGRRTVVLSLHAVKYPVFVTVEVERTAVLYTVAVNDGARFRCEEASQTVEEGKSAQFTLWFEGDYTFDSAYSEYGEIRYHAAGVDGEVNENSERRVVLTVEDVRADAVINVREKRYAQSDEPVLVPVQDVASVYYSLNGGRYKNDGISGSYYTVNYPLTHYPRPNTSLGTDVICREGYTLTGWNTQRDGRGEHIGLGSRVSVSKNEAILLYAEWEKQADPELFGYALIRSDEISALYMEKGDKLQKLQSLVVGAETGEELSAVITEYRGGDQKLVVPAELDGYPVAAVALRACASCRELTTVVLPETMRYVMSRAFLNCNALREIYLFDSLHYIDYNAFGLECPIETMHINAKLPPIYGTNESAQLANKLEMLIEHRDEKKTVLFGSCASWYGINAEMFGRATDRLTFNMGVEGDTCALVQLDLIKQYMNEGDTLIYNCDMGSPYLMLYDLSFDPRAFRLFEFNYDLLSLVNLTDYEKVISSLNDYLIIKYNETSWGTTGTYEDCLDYITEFGDMGKERVGSTHDGTYKAASTQEILGNGAFEKIKTVFGTFADAGIDIYFSFGTICEDAISEESIGELNDLFYTEFESHNIPATIIASFYESILPSNQFYDYAYRLNSEGSRLYTQRFVNNFLAAAGKGE